MTDDLVKRLREYAADWRDRAASNAVVLEAADALEAATRLSAQPAEVEAVEGVVRKALGDCISMLQHIDEHGDQMMPLAHLIKAGLAALAIRPSGAEMRERAAKVCEKRARLLRDGSPIARRLGRHKLATAGEKAAEENEECARLIRALPLPPEEAPGDG